MSNIRKNNLISQDTESDTDTERSPDNKRGKGEGGTAMSNKGRGRGAGGGTRRDSMENTGSIKDVLDALEQLRGDLGARMDTLNAKMEKLEDSHKKVKQLEVRLTKIERSTRQAEVDEKRMWVVVRGLWKQADTDRFESRSQLSTSLEELKLAMGAKISFMEYYRLKDLTRNGKMYPGLVKAKFITSDDRDRFFSRLPEVGSNKDLELITFQQDIPSFLVEKYKRLDGQAFKLRRQDKVKTRVIIRNLDLQLQQRASKDQKWANVDEEQEE